MSADGIPEETGEEAKGKAEELAWSLPLGQMTKAVLCGKELPLWGEVLGLRTIMLTWFWSEKAEASIVLGICPCCYDEITHKSNLRMFILAYSSRDKNPPLHKDMSAGV